MQLWALSILEPLAGVTFDMLPVAVVKKPAILSSIYKMVVHVIGPAKLYFREKTLSGRYSYVFVLDAKLAITMPEVVFIPIFSDHSSKNIGQSIKCTLINI